MADSAAVRTRRSRKHSDGDHSLCIPGRCEALDESVGELPASLGLGSAGQTLHDAVTAAATGDLPPTTAVLLLESCRIVDRLERLDNQLHGRDWLRFRWPEERDGHVIVHMDRALAEAREQATALRGLLADIDRALSGSGISKPVEGGGVLADLTARIAARRGTAAS